MQIHTDGELPYSIAANVYHQPINFHLKIRSLSRSSFQAVRNGSGVQLGVWLHEGGHRAICSAWFG
jgi:hypothetical protein